MPFLRRSFPLLLLILIFGLVTACSNTPAPTEVPTPVVTASPVATETPSPTPTNPLPLAILLAPEGADAALVATLQEKMAALATQDSLQFETRSSLTATDANPNLSIVVAISPDPGIAQLAVSAPETQFLALGIPGIQPAANLSVVGGSDGLPDQMGFIAGYLAAVITDDWRVGVISSDDAAGQIAAQGFRNGVVFFCGLCRPSFPPFYEYPILASPPSQAAIDSLVGQGVQTAYLPPQASVPALSESLAQVNLNLIGSTPPPENLKNRWVATIQTDLPAGLERLWSEMVGGKGGISLPTPIVITDRNEALFSIGRQRLVDETLTDLQDGYIGTGVTPP